MNECCGPAGDGSTADQCAKPARASAGKHNHLAVTGMSGPTLALVVVGGLELVVCGFALVRRSARR
jgi:hypothetical protein